MKIEYFEIEEAFDFVSSGRPFEHHAVLDRDSGKIYFHSEYMELDGFEELPDDINDEKYIEFLTRMISN